MTEALVQGILDRFLGKYLKNITTEHATVWGGQLIFKNVELRLDVLQAEVGLPVVIQRGFIQELKVFLPLANLLREHIKFTFSNVEVVAQRPETLKVSARSPNNPKAQKGKDASSQRDHEKAVDGAQEGWMRQLLSRIALNLRVEVRNVVFKYCTDEYVSTVSWKRLAVEPTNGQWQRVFADFEGATRASFKEVEIEDITWCLDCVDASGGVPHFQPPLFNRENLTIRVIQRKLPDGPPGHAKHPFGLPASQVHVRSERVCMTVSRTQLEMLVRLVEELDDMVTQIKRNKKTADAALRAEGAESGAESELRAAGRRRGSEERGGAERQAPVSARSRTESVTSSATESVRGGGGGEGASGKGGKGGGWMQSLLNFASNPSDDTEDDIDDDDEEEEDEEVLGAWAEEEQGGESDAERMEHGRAGASHAGRGAGGRAVVVESLACVEVGEWAINLTCSAKDGPPLYVSGRAMSRTGSEGGERSVVWMRLRGRDAAALSRSELIRPPPHSPLPVSQTLTDARLVLGEAQVDFVDAPCSHQFIAAAQPAQAPLMLGAASLFRGSEREEDEDESEASVRSLWSRSGSQRNDNRQPRQKELLSESPFAAVALSQLFTSPLDPRPPSPPCSGTSSSVQLPARPSPVAGSAEGVLSGRGEGRGETRLVWPPPNSPLLCLAVTSLKHSVHLGEASSRPPSVPSSPAPHRPSASVPPSPACHPPRPSSPRLSSHASSVPASPLRQHHVRPPTSPKVEALAEPVGGWTWSARGGEEAREDGMWLQLVVQPLQVMVHDRLSVMVEEFTKDVGKTPGGKPQGQRKSKRDKVAKHFGKVPPVLLLDVSFSALQVAWVALEQVQHGDPAGRGAMPLREGERSGLVCGCEGVTMWRSRAGLHPGGERLIGRDRREGAVEGGEQDKVSAFLGQVTGMWVGVGNVTVRGGEALGFVQRVRVLTTSACIGSLAGTVDKERGRAWLQFGVERAELAMTYEDLKQVLLVMQPGGMGGGTGGVSSGGECCAGRQHKVIGNGRGLLVEGVLSLDGVEGAVRVGGWSLRSPFCDLEGGWEQARGSGGEGAAMVTEGLMPWDAGEGVGQAGFALGRACGLGKAACKALKFAVRARSAVGPFSYRVSAAELLPLLALLAPPDPAPALAPVPRAKREGVGAEAWGLGEGEAPITPLMETLAQVDSLRRENEALKERCHALLALHHVPSPAALRGAVADEGGASLWGGGGKYAALETEGGGGSGESDGERDGDESKRRGAGRLGLKLMSRRGWFAARVGASSPGDMSSTFDVCGVLRRLRLRPTVAGLLSYALLLHFVIAYLLHDLSRRAAAQ